MAEGVCLTPAAHPLPPAAARGGQGCSPQDSLSFQHEVQILRLYVRAFVPLQV